MLWIFIFVISAFISSGSGDASHPSSFMQGQKPILRMGLDEEDDDPEHQEFLKVPDWVSNLRYAIDEQVNKMGLRNAGAKIKQIINDVADDVDELGLQGNEEPDPHEYSEKKGLRTLAEADEHRHPSKPGITGDPLWMTDLKSYVRDLVSTKGRNDLDSFVRPVIASVEKNNHVKINDIDVNPYGEIFINYEKVQNPKKSTKYLKTTGCGHLGRVAPVFRGALCTAVTSFADDAALAVRQKENMPGLRYDPTDEIY